MVEDWIWDGPDDLPGCGVTLALLYYFVPTAEEVDLLDELEHDRRRAAWDVLYDEFASAEEGSLNADRDEDDQDEATTVPMSLGQILGMLEHILGAEIIDDSVDGDVDDG